MKKIIKNVTNEDIVNGSFVIPDGVTEIRDWAFEDCTSLLSIIIPESVTKIGDYAFHVCSSLKKVSLPKKQRGLNEIVLFRNTLCILLNFVSTPFLRQLLCN